MAANHIKQLRAGTTFHVLQKRGTTVSHRPDLSPRTTPPAPPLTLGLASNPCLPVQHIQSSPLYIDTLIRNQRRTQASGWKRGNLCLPQQWRADD